MESTFTVEQLLTLQEIDLEILRITQQLDEFQVELEALQEEVTALEGRASALRGRKEEAEERVRRFQRSVQAGRATLKRLEARSAEITNMKQHFAVRTETETARRNLRAAEDETLDAMQDVETAAAELDEVEAELEAARAGYETRRTEVAGLRENLEGELAERRDQKRGQEATLDRRSLRLYEKVRNGRPDGALAALTGDGVCGRCFTAVPLQRQADIRAGRELSVCEGCGVILYVALPGD